MREPIWRRSLYWRGVLGFSACIAVTLAVQLIAVQLWLATTPDSDQLRAFTRGVADDLGRVISEHPSIDVQRYVDEHYPQPVATLYIVMANDGRVILRGPLTPPQESVQGAREFYRANPSPVALPDSWSLPPFHSSAIMVNGRVAGGVGVVSYSWRQLIGWKMALLSGILMLGAAAIAGRFVFRRIERRLVDLEAAARQCGDGDFTARAHDLAPDELGALAVAFNRMAESLGTRDEQLKQSDRTRRLLLADVSHELMTPLTAVRAYREVLAMSDAARSPEAMHCLQVIADETNRLERLVGDLLELARLEAGGDALHIEDVSVENLVGRIAVRHEPEARQKGVTLSTSVGEGAEVLFGDGLRLEQALQNLAANALRHTPPGGEIAVRAEMHDDYLLLSVRDTGRGIPAEHLPYVFDRFYKVDPARADDRSGSGLGLSIVKAIVERHGGSVSAVSNPGVATIFTIRLPIQAIAA